MSARRRALPPIVAAEIPLGLLTGAAVGAFAGPVGLVVGAVMGAAVGAVFSVAHARAEHWRQEQVDRPL